MTSIIKKIKSLNFKLFIKNKINYSETFIILNLFFKYSINIKKLKIIF